MTKSLAMPVLKAGFCRMSRRMRPHQPSQSETLKTTNTSRPDFAASASPAASSSGSGTASVAVGFTTGGFAAPACGTSAARAMAAPANSVSSDSGRRGFIPTGTIRSAQGSGDSSRALFRTAGEQRLQRASGRAAIAGAPVAGGDGHPGACGSVGEEGGQRLRSFVGILDPPRRADGGEVPADVAEIAHRRAEDLRYAEQGALDGRLAAFVRRQAFADEGEIGDSRQPAQFTGRVGDADFGGEGGRRVPGSEIMRRAGRFLKARPVRRDVRRDAASGATGHALPRRASSWKVSKSSASSPGHVEEPSSTSGRAARHSPKSSVKSARRSVSDGGGPTSTSLFRLPEQEDFSGGTPRSRSRARSLSVPASTRSNLRSNREASGRTLP